MRNSEAGKSDIGKNRDLFIILVLVFVGFLGLGLFLLLGRNAGTVEISVDGKVLDTFSLDTDKTVIIPGYAGITDELVFENGSVYMKEATCPDGLCIRMGHISMTGQSIVCLPARIVVTVKENRKKSEVDAIAGGMIVE